MSNERSSNVSTISPNLLLRVLTITMQTRKSLSRWCSSWMTVWLKPTFNTSLTMHGIFTLKSSNLVYVVPFINVLCHSINSNVVKFYYRMPFLAPTQYSDGYNHFYWDAISSWLSTEAEEQFACPCDEDYDPSDIIVEFQEVLGVRLKNVEWKLLFCY